MALHTSSAVVFTIILEIKKLGFPYLKLITFLRKQQVSGGRTEIQT